MTKGTRRSCCGNNKSLLSSFTFTLVFSLVLFNIVQAKLTSIDETPAQYNNKGSVKEINDESTLELVIITHRHGDRTPIYYPEEELDYVPWPEGYGQLTSTGISQLYRLGLTLRSSIPTDLMDSSYTADIVKVRASDTDRTLQSAFSLLTGFYPPGTGPSYPFEYPSSSQTPSLPSSIQPVPIHTVDPHSDYLLRSFDNCKRYQEYLKYDVFTSQAAIDLQNENSDLLSLLSSTFNMTITLSNLNMAYDVLYCEQAHGYWGVRGIDNETYSRVVELENKVFSEFEFAPTEMSYLIGAPLIGSFISDIDSFINGSNSYTRLYHYSGHDVSVGSLLSGLGYQMAEVPPYAAHFILQLHLINGVFSLRFFYNDEPIILPLCSSELDPFLCPYSLFKSVYGPMVPEDAAAACAVDSPLPPSPPPSDNTNPYNDGGDGDGDGGDDSDPYLTFFILGFVGLFLLAVIIAVIALIGYKRYQLRLSSPSNDLGDDDLSPSYELSEIDPSPSPSKLSDDI